MSYKLITSSLFDREIKRLNKKYPSLKKDITRLGESLKETPTQGTPLGQNCYKIRLSISSKKKGKRGGARVITHVRVVGETVYLLSIYDKSERETISDHEIDTFLGSLDEGPANADKPDITPDAPPA